MKKLALTPDMLWKKIDKNMKRYRKYNFLESYAVFMGRAQAVEWGLKRILRRKYRLGDRRLDRMTLGGAIGELERRGMRPDFIFVLRELNKVRINMAHEFLLDFSLMVSLDRRFAHSHSHMRSLSRAMFEAERSVHVFDHLNQSKMFYKRQRKPY
jgi:hypothetical protein